MSDYEQQEIFLQTVKSGLQKWPDLLPRVVMMASAGVQANLEEMRDKAVDCEVLAVLAMARRTKHTDGAILAKLKKLQGRSWCVWDEEIKQLEEKLGKRK